MLHSSESRGKRTWGTIAVIDDNQQATKHFSSKHEFHDTKHRNVTYMAVATTRFMEYFPDSLRSDSANFTRTWTPRQ